MIEKILFEIFFIIFVDCGNDLKIYINSIFNGDLNLMGESVVCSDVEMILANFFYI